MTAALKAHWPEYLMEATGLGVFMISACVFGVLLFHPSSPITQIIAGDTARRILMGVAMGSTAVAIIFSPFGKRSGAHINPAVTLTFFRLGKIEPWDAAFYTLFQLIGGIAGVLLATLFLGSLISHRSVNYAVTVPGAAGPAVAFLAEMTISFITLGDSLLVNKAR
jgi:aquaporin Z